MQDVKFSKPLDSMRPKNRIEAALSKASANTAETFLPSIDKRNDRFENQYEPLQVIRDEPKLADEVKKARPRFKALLFLSVLLLVALSYAGYRNYAYFSHLWDSGSPGDYTNIVSEVGKLVALPPGEDPTVATVTNLEPLAGQEFFKDAMVGDKVLIFSKSKKAVLYRPSEKRVVVMAPLNN